VPQAQYGLDEPALGGAFAGLRWSAVVMEQKSTKKQRPFMRL